MCDMALLWADEPFEVEKSYVEFIFRGNPDGYGVWGVDGKGVMRVFKHMKMEHVVKYITRRTWRIVAFHGRAGTSGAKNLTNAHPIISKKGYYYFMNGVVTIPKPKGWSDARALANLLDSMTWKEAIECLEDAGYHVAHIYVRYPRIVFVNKRDYKLQECDGIHVIDKHGKGEDFRLVELLVKKSKVRVVRVKKPEIRYITYRRQGWIWERNGYTVREVTVSTSKTPKKESNKPRRSFYGWYQGKWVFVEEFDDYYYIYDGNTYDLLRILPKWKRFEIKEAYSDWWDYVI